MSSSSGGGHIPLDSIATPSVARVADFAAAAARLAEPRVMVAAIPAPPFAFQHALDLYVERTPGLYVVLSGDADQRRSRLRSYLTGKEMFPAELRDAFVEHVCGMTDAWAGLRRLGPDDFDVTIATTQSERTRSEEWHIDSFDDSGSCYQLLATLSGAEGPVIALEDAYDHNILADVRQRRRRLEAWRANIIGSGRAWTEAHEAHVQLLREVHVTELEVGFASTAGVQADPGTILAFRGGFTPHTSPATHARRLIMVLVEFDELQRFGAREALVG